MRHRQKMNLSNSDERTVKGFGDEWEQFDQSKLDDDEHKAMFEKYFCLFPWQSLSRNSIGFDMGCGSGRWAKLVSPRVGTLHCIDPSSAIEVARRNLADESNCEFHHAGLEEKVLPEGSMDFGYSLGVLHHLPDTAQGIRDCVRLLKPRAPFLLYLYYAFDNRSLAYSVLWRITDIFRVIISRLPYIIRYALSQIIAVLVYWPLARLSAFLELVGLSHSTVSKFPLCYYRHLSFYTMRTDALDRFGTRLEQRFTRREMKFLMEDAGLEDIRFSKNAPYWCAVGTRIK